MEFIRKHAVAFITGVILFVVTFGFWGLYKLYKYKRG